MTDEAVDILRRAGLFHDVMDALLERIQHHLDRRAEGAVQVGAAVYNTDTLLGLTAAAEAILKDWNVKISEGE